MEIPAKDHRANSIFLLIVQIKLNFFTQVFSFSFNIWSKNKKQSQWQVITNPMTRRKIGMKGAEMGFILHLVYLVRKKYSIILEAASKINPHLN